jgi:hypothetical protein
MINAVVSITKTDGGSAGYFARSCGFQVSECKYLMIFITRLVLFEIERSGRRIVICCEEALVTF